jgi:hypothetical protein
MEINMSASIDYFKTIFNTNKKVLALRFVYCTSFFVAGLAMCTNVTRIF